MDTAVPETSPNLERLRELLHRRELAVVRHRAAIARQLGMSDTEILALAHVARHGELTQTQLGTLLDLSSGGTAALVQRMERSGYVVRRGAPDDKRLRLISVAPAMAERAARAYEPLVADLERLLGELGEREELVTAFLDALVEVTEGHAEREWRALRPSDPPRAAGLPSLWG